MNASQKENPVVAPEPAQTHIPPHSSLANGVCVAAFAFLVISVSIVLMNAFGINVLGYPRLKLEPAKIQLGDVAPNTTVSVSVTVRNVGRGALKLQAVKSSCDACIRVKSWPKEEISADDQRNILLEIDTGDAPGVIQKQVVVLSNDWSGKPYVLKCSWKSTATNDQ